MLSDACVSLPPRFVAYLQFFCRRLENLNDCVVNSHETILMKVME
jgi:hypothetical protein